MITMTPNLSVSAQPCSVQDAWDRGICVGHPVRYIGSIAEFVGRTCTVQYFIGGRVMVRFYCGQQLSVRTSSLEAIQW